MGARERIDIPSMYCLRLLVCCVGHVREHRNIGKPSLAICFGWTNFFTIKLQDYLLAIRCDCFLIMVISFNLCFVEHFMFTRGTLFIEAFNFYFYK